MDYYLHVIHLPTSSSRDGDGVAEGSHRESRVSRKREREREREKRRWSAASLVFHENVSYD
jgi:hypothetical protein